jgi:lysophospholipid acyltransferase (LPLAT)-like uncharacterized protein
VASDAKRRRPDWRLTIGVRLGVAILRLLAATWRYRVRNAEAVTSLRRGRTPFLWSLWHGEMLPVLWLHRDQAVRVLISEHRDGEIIARVAHALGYGTLRGSSSRGGARALLEIVREIESGREIAITPDGPRGPAHRVAPGILAAAQRTGAPIIGVRATAGRVWRLRSWDGFMIPKTFTTVTVTYGGPLRVGATSARRAEEEAPRLEALMALAADAAAEDGR